ncbi:MAG: glycosyltransferase [Thermoleophilia bacterium]
MSVAVVVATVHRPDDVAVALDAVLAGDPPPAEVHVLDQSDDDRTRAVLAPYAARGAIVSRLSPPGLSRALNAGIGRASTELVAITGDDCVARPDWLAAIERAFAADPRLAILFGQVASGPCDPAVGFVPGCRIEAEVALDRLRDVGRLNGTTACMAVRREAWLALGGFDEQLGLGAPLRSGEDLDLALRALAAGWRVLQTPAVEVEHLTPVPWAGRARVVRRNWHGSGAAFAKSQARAGRDGAGAARARRPLGSGGSGVAVTYGVRPHRSAMLVGLPAASSSGSSAPSAAAAAASAGCRCAGESARSVHRA